MGDDDDLFLDSDVEENDDWDDLSCGMGSDGQCGQAGSEWCDFECPLMAKVRAASREPKRS